MAQWIDRGSYYEHTSPQGTDPWKNARFGRVNSSNSGGFAGESNFKTVEQIGKYIAGVESEVFLSKNIAAIDHGKNTEPIVRRWYENKYKCKILERGLCVPKKDYTIGACRSFALLPYSICNNSARQDYG